MKRCVIIGGAGIGRYDEIRACLQPDDFNIFCDSGLYHEERLGITPHLIVGDFDSHPWPVHDAEIIELPREKDDTDTVYAVKEALRRGFEEFLLIGVVGARLDHSLGNVSILFMLHTAGKQGIIVDDYGEMAVVSDKPVYVENCFPYFSLLNVTGTAKGITIKNAKYPLTNAEISCEYQYGISNEVLPGQRAEITVKDGKLLLIRVRNA